MLLPTINSASVNDDGTRLEGYLASDWGDPVRIYFYHRPSIDLTTFTTFIGRDIASTARPV